MKKLILHTLMLLMPTALLAQQPSKVTEKWFPKPEGITMDIPVFAKKKGFTSHEEMLQFINQRAVEHPTLITIEVVGKTQRGRDIPLVTVKKNDGDEGRLRVLYLARIHGDEPAGTEAMLYFIRQLAEDAQVSKLLDKMDFYIMPMINADGAEKMDRYTANGIDLNRDQSKLDTPEAVALHGVANRVKQDITVDFHEYQPVKALYSQLSRSVLSTPWDVMFLYSSNPNVPQPLRNAVDDLFLPELRKAMDGKRLTHATYFTPREDSKGVVFNIGGSSPRSSTNAMALRGSVSFLMEIRGIKLDRISVLRRIYTTYIAALNVAQTAYENEESLRKTLKEAAEDRSDIAVDFSAKKVDSDPMLFLDLIKNDTLSINVRKSLGTEQTVTKSLPVPDFYYILPSETKAIELLGKMGIETSTLSEPEMLHVECYTVIKSVVENEAIGGVLPVKVDTEIIKKDMEFPVGTIVIPTNQRYIRLATVLLEPESSNGFVNFRVIESVVGKDIPVYRINK